MTPKKILKAIIFTSIFLVPFIPFVVTGGMFFPFITGKNLIFRVLIEVMAVAWIILAFRDIEYRPKKSILLYAFVAFVALIGISDAMALNVGKAFWSNFERMEGWVTLAHLLAYFVVLGNMFKDEKMWSRLFHTSLAAATLISLYGLGQLFDWFTINQGGVRLDATLGNATYLAVYLIFHVFFAFLFMVRSVPKWWRVFGYGAVATLFTFILYSTATRGAAVGIVVGSIISLLLIVIFAKSEKTIRKGAFVLLGIVIFTVLGFVSLKDTEAVKSHPVLGRYASISVKDFAQSARAMVWPMAIQGFKERPMFGWGQENFNYVFNKNYNPGMYAQEQWFDRTHNVVLDWLIAGGIFGLLAYLFLYGSGLYVLWRRSNLSFIERSVFTGLLSAYFIHNLFVFDNITSYILFVTVLAYFYSHSGVPFKQISQVDTEVSDNTLARVFLPLGLVVLIVLVYLVNWGAYSSSKSLIGALRQVNSTPINTEATLSLFKKALSYQSLGQSEIRERMIETIPTVNNSSGSIIVKEEFFKLGKEEIEKQLEATPNDTRYLIYAGNFHAQDGEIDKAIDYLEKALASSPRKQSILYQLGNLYFVKGDKEKALAAFKEAYDVAPENDEALGFYGAAAMYAGETKLGEELLKKRFGSTIFPDARLAQMYIDVKDWNRATLVWEALIKTDPNNVDYRIKLAGTLLQAEERERAVKAIRDVIELQPEFKEQGEYYIKEIEAGRNP